MSDNIRIGVIGGSGIHQIKALVDLQEISQTTPFGSASSTYTVGKIHGQKVAFLARHGHGHTTSPTRLNHRANIYGFKQMGVEYLISANACGSVRPHLEVGTIVVPDQLYDNTRLRSLSFFDDPATGTGGVVAHIPFEEPFCPFLNAICVQALQETGAHVVAGGNFLTIEGPRFSSRFETNTFASWGADILGMTTSPEAQLAREAEMSFSVMAHITDQDTVDEEESVSVEVVLANVARNVAAINAAVERAVTLLADAPPSPQADTLAHSIQTNPDYITRAQVEAVPALLGKYFQPDTTP